MTAAPTSRTYRRALPPVNQLLALLLLLSLHGLRAAEPPGYYAPANSLTGAALRAALHGIIDNHTVVSYGDARFALEDLDEDPANTANLILIYERTSYPKASWINTVPGGWNREHCWPNSLGIDDAGPEYSDLYNLRPCRESVNSDRGNLYYDESTLNGGGYQAPAHNLATLCTQDSDSWEPAAEVKGDLARAMFYMDLRYEGTAGEPNLALTDNVAAITTGNANMGRLTTLLLWHLLDPVSPAERTRAEGVYGYQGNRNPFVDRPEWVEAIYGAVFSLTATRSGTQLQLTWPAALPTDVAFIQTSTDLTTWPAATLTITTSAGQNSALVPLSPAPRYYRLKLQPRPG